MKKINLLVITLLFVMTAKADNNQAIQEACEAKKSLSTCYEDSENNQEMTACGSTYNNTYENLSKKYNYKEEGNYKLNNTEGMFSYSITSKPPASSDVAYSFPIQVDPSCNKSHELVESAIDKISTFKFLVWSIDGGDAIMNVLSANTPNLFSTMKMCLVSTTNQLSKFQGCSQ